MARVLRHVLQDLTKRATCASAARIAGLERAYFSKLFRSVMRVSFTEWNARVRVEEAKRLLRAIDLSITAVGASVGYDDVTTFERVFKRLEGVCPREHRRGLARASCTANTERRNRNTERRDRYAHRANNVSLPIWFLQNRERSMKHRSSFLRFVLASFVLLGGAVGAAHAAPAVAVHKCSSTLATARSR